MALLRRSVEKIWPGNKLSPEAARLVYRGFYAWADFTAISKNEIGRLSKIQRRVTIAFPGSMPHVDECYQSPKETSIVDESGHDGLNTTNIEEINEKRQRVVRVEKIARRLKWSTVGAIVVGLALFGISKAPVRAELKSPDCPAILAEGTAVAPEETYENLGVQITQEFEAYKKADYRTRNAPGGVGKNEIAQLQIAFRVLGFNNTNYEQNNGCIGSGDYLVKVNEHAWLNAQSILQRAQNPNQ